MHNFQLPQLPLPVVSQAYQASPNGAPERIQLAPLQIDPTSYPVPQSVRMQRQQSVSSATDSGQSTYYDSCSTSPTVTPCASPRFVTATYRKRHSQASSISSESSRTSTSAATQKPATGKASRGKRHDRHLYSKLGKAAAGAAKTPAASKDQSEAGSRFDHTSLLGMKQNQLIRMIPDLPTKARTGNGRTQVGWKQLNTNNISRDLSNPLTVNKQEVHISEIQVTQDDEELFDNIEAMCKAHEQEAAALTRSRPTYATLMDFVERTSQANRAGRISSTRLQRGTHDFRLPFC